MSAQRITYAISRDGMLPFSKFFSRLSPKSHMPVNAAYLVVFMGIVLTLPIIGSVVAFSVSQHLTLHPLPGYAFPAISRRNTDNRT